MNFETFLVDFEKAKGAFPVFAVVTFVNARGSAPQEAGARLIVGPEGYFAGTVGGGKLENAAIMKAREYIAAGETTSRFHEWNLQTDLGMSCGGAVSLFFEVHSSRKNWNIVVFGAGHVSQELVRALLRMECQVTCVDSREEWLSKLPSDGKLRRVRLENMVDFVSEIPTSSFVVSATMGHATDQPILEALLKRSSFPYVGAIGSEVKAARLKSELLERGVPNERIAALNCPIGEPIGNNTPPEIAISIAAQMLRVRGN